MSEREIKIKEVVEYGGHSIKPSGAVDLTLIAEYGELVKTIQALQLLNNDVTIKARIPGDKPFLLGSFRIKTVIIDGDGESKLKFNSLTDFVEVSNFNRLPLKTDDNPRFHVMLESTVEIEDD